MAESRFRTKVHQALVKNLAFRRWLIAVLLQTVEEPPKPPHSPKRQESGRLKAHLRVLDGGLSN